MCIQIHQNFVLIVEYNVKRLTFRDTCSIIISMKEILTQNC